MATLDSKEILAESDSRRAGIVTGVTGDCMERSGTGPAGEDGS